MLKFAANLSLMYPEFAFLERFGAAASDGFKAVEFMFPYEYSAAEIKAQLDAHSLQLVLLNAPAGGELSGAGELDALSGAAAWAAGARGLAALPGREAEFRASM
jgi:2-dehydrotetronate isomerase